MKLSEAIREGARRYPYGTGDYLRDGCACAIGGAVLAAGLMTEVELIRAQTAIALVMRHWNVGHRIVGDVLARSDSPTRYHYDAKDPRPQIADWVEEQGY